MNIRKRLDAWLAGAVKDLPRQIIGKEFFPDHLMERYHLLHLEPLGRFPFLRVFVPADSDDKRLPKLVLHRFLRGDNRQKGIHTHPWWCASLVILGSYTERFVTPAGLETRVRRFLSFGFNSIHHAHIVTEISEGSPCWTLALIGPWAQEWGFPDVGEVVRNAAGKAVHKADEHLRCAGTDSDPDRCAICRRPRSAWLGGAR